MYGVAQLMCDWHYESDDEEELDQIDRPFEYKK